MVNPDDSLRQAARRFLRTGSIGRSDPVALASACDKLVRAETQRSLKKACELGRAFVKHAEHNDEIPLQLALRSLGWALHCSGKYRQAEKTYLQARKAAGRNASIRARIDRILIDVYMYLGDMSEARRRARLALSTFARVKDETEAAKTRINYANLLHRLDRHRESNKQYQKAAEYFEAHGGNLILGLCYYNQANTLVQLLDFDKARALYQKATEKFKSRGFDLYVNECQYGLAWLSMLQGDYHVALAELSECELKYRRACQPKGAMLCLLDRAEAFLGLNLFDDALRAAAGAERQARKLGLRYEASKAAFFLAKAGHGLSKERIVRAALDRAESGFADEGNHGFLAAVQLFAAQIDPDQDGSASRLNTVRQRFSRVQLPLWEAICDLQLLTSRPDDPATRRRLSCNQAVNAVPHLYAHWQTLLGDAAARRGRMSIASRHWTQAVEVLDAVRAKLPPVDMRSSFMKKRDDPYLRLVSHEAIKNPSKAAVWSERHKTAGLWATDHAVLASDNLREKAAQSLALLASQVTVLSGRIVRRTGKRSSPRPQEKRILARLQGRVRQDLAAIEGHSRNGNRLESNLLEDFSRVSRSDPVVQFHYDGDDLVAFIHDDGDTRTRYIANGRRFIHQSMGLLRILLCRNLNHDGKQYKIDLGEESRLFERIGDTIWSPLEISGRRQRVLILPEGELSNMPWLAVVCGGQALVERHKIVVSPSLRHHLHALKIRVRSRRIDVFVGSSNGLSHTQDDLPALSNRIGAQITVHNPCRRHDWPDSGRAWLWHYAGHAQFRSDNPFYSSLTLSDGPLFAADFRLKTSQVFLVTLAACRTAFQTILPGEESTGMVRSLLEMGAQNVVGSHWAVSDKSTALWMTMFYDCIFNGQPVSEAVRRTAIQVREKYPSACDWAAYSVFGAG